MVPGKSPRTFYGQRRRKDPGGGSGPLPQSGLRLSGHYRPLEALQGRDGPGAAAAPRVRIRRGKHGGCGHLSHRGHRAGAAGSSETDRRAHRPGGPGRHPAGRGIRHSGPPVLVPEPARGNLQAQGRGCLGNLQHPFRRALERPPGRFQRDSGYGGGSGDGAAPGGLGRQPFLHRRGLPELHLAPGGGADGKGRSGQPPGRAVLRLPGAPDGDGVGRRGPAGPLLPGPDGGVLLRSGLFRPAGFGITQAEYRPGGNETFLRAEVIDADGKKAWSSPVVLR